MKRFDWRALARSTSGNVLPITAVSIIVLAGLIGGAVDIARAYMVKNQLQNACDAGVLAGRRAVTTNGFDSGAKRQADLYFNANFRMDGNTVSNTRFQTSSDETGNEVAGSASTRMSTAVMNLFGKNSIDLNAACMASMSVGNSDVMMVLDVTGSMGAPISKMRALQAAMKNFYDTVAAAKAGSNARVRFGFVPYSSSVNVGRLIYDLNPDYLVDSYTVNSRVAEYVERSFFGFKWKEFVGWTYQPVSDFDYATYKSFRPVTTLTGGTDRPANVTSTWAGCIEERETVPAASFSYSRLGKMTPGGAQDLDLDSAPDLSDDRTKWAPMWPEVAYSRAKLPQDTSGSKAGGPCPAPARLLSEMNKAQFDAVADSLVPTGSTYHDIGLIWGGRLISPDGIFSANVNERAANGGAVSRHIIFMTDGNMEPSTTTQSSYGIEALDRRVTGNGSSSQQVARHNSRYLAICEAIKAKGTHIWAVAFGLDLTKEVHRTALANLTTCADSGSVFKADDAQQLNEAFQDIAKEVGELRIRR